MKDIVPDPRNDALIGAGKSYLVRLLSHWRARTSPHWPWLRRLFSLVLLVASALFMAHTIHGQYTALGRTALGIAWFDYFVITLLATATVMLTAAIHACVLNRLAPTRIRFVHACYAYAASQVARYVPGKVFGVIMEVEVLAPLATFRTVLLALLAQTALTYLWSGTLSIVLLTAAYFRLWWLLGLLPVALLLLWVAQERLWLERMVEFLVPRKQSMAAESAPAPRRHAQALLGTGLLLLEWIPFFFLWWLLAGGNIGFLRSGVLAGCYIAASIFGSLLVIIPSGIVVREAAFTVLAGLFGIAAAPAIAWAVVVRLALTFADLASAGLLWFASRHAVRDTRIGP